MAVSEKILSDKIEKYSLAEELRNERENDTIAFNTKYSHKEDLENLLKLAESLKDSCDKMKASIKKQKFLTVIFSLAFVLLTVINFLVEGNIDYIIIFAGGFVLISSIVLDQLVLVAYPKQRYNADKLALSEVLQLLRETSDIIAEQEYWSVLSRAEFRIRLSRFNLEEKSESVFNFFS